MSQMEAVFFNCDGTLVDSEIIRLRAYVTMFREFGIHVNLGEIFTRFKGTKFYEIIDIINKERDATMVQTDVEYAYCAEAARLSNTELEDTTGVNKLLTSINVPTYVVSNGPVNKMRHSPGKLNTLHYFPEKLFSGYDIQRRKLDPALVFCTTKAMNVNVENCILINDFDAGAQSGVDVGMEVFCFCVDPHNRPIVHPKATIFTHLSQLLELWKARGWDIAAQLFAPPSFTPLKLTRKGKQKEFDMSVSRRVIHHGLYFVVLGPLISVLFPIPYIFFAEEPLIPLIIIQVLPLFILLSIATGAIPTMLVGITVACLSEKIRSQGRYRCLVGDIDGVVITEIYCVAIMHIRDIASSALFENILPGENPVIRIIPALLVGVVMSRIVIYLPRLDISCPEIDSLS